MYCPKCGRKIIDSEGTLKCEAGDMSLSRHLQRLLLGAFPEEQPRSGETATGAELGRWFCPSCGVLMDGSQSCPNCRRAMTREQIYNLVERHPHLREDGQEYV